MRDNERVPNFQRVCLESDRQRQMAETALLSRRESAQAVTKRKWCRKEDPDGAVRCPRWVVPGGCGQVFSRRSLGNHDIAAQKSTSNASIGTEAYRPGLGLG